MTVIKPAGERSLGQELGTALRRLALPVVLIGGVVVLLGLLFTRVLDNSDVADADSWVDRELAQSRTPTGNDLTHYGSLLGETPTIIGLTALAAVIFRAVFHRWRESVLLVLCVSGQALIFMITQMLIDRQRPSVPRLDDSPPTSSFPSGHTSAAVALYLGLALLLSTMVRRTWAKWLCWGLVLLPVSVAVARMYRGMHHPTDVVGSFVNGVTCVTIMARGILDRSVRWARGRAGLGPVARRTRSAGQPA